MMTRRDFISRAGSLAAALGLGRAETRGALSQEALPSNVLAGVVSLTPADFEARRERARALLVENGLDGLFLGAGTNLLYFANVSWWQSERTFGVVLGRSGDPVWVCPAFEKERALELVPAGQNVRVWEEHESPFALIAGIMRDRGAAAGRLALDPDLRSFEVFGLRREAPSLELVNGMPVTGGCRAVKTEKEVAYMDLANKITKLAYREGFKQIREGMTQRDLAGTIGAAFQKMGVAGGAGPQLGLNTAFPHGSRNPRISGQNEVIMVDGGCSVEGFRADVTRTIVHGTPTDKQRRVWDIVKRAQGAALKAARPGAACEDVDRAGRRVVEEAGFGPGYTYFGHRLGHGIGMEGHEYPYLVRGNTLKVEPGMTFSNEPGIYIYGEFGVRVEDCMVITADGARFLGGMESTAIDAPFGE